MKKLLSVIAVILFVTSLNAFALRQRLNDEAGLLTENQRSYVQSYLDSTSSRLGADVVIATTKTGYGIDSFAEDYYINSGFSQDGIVLMIAYRGVGNSELSVRIFGECRKYFTQKNIDTFLDEMQASAKTGDFKQMFIKFADMSEKYIESGQSGLISRDYSKILLAALASMLAGFLIALVIVLIMKSKLKSVRYRNYAYEYTKPNSFVLNEKKDIYLFSTVTRQAKPQNNNSNHSGTSSGGSRSF